MSRFRNLRLIGVRDRVSIHSAVPADFHSVAQIIERVAPREIYNLSGQSSVGLSFEQPVETLESNVNATLNILECVRLANRAVRVYNASSGECYGDTGDVPANEETAFRPRSPYGVAKAAAHWQVSVYRDAYGVFACSGVLFNHESPLRPERFVTRKIARAAARIAAGSGDPLALGELGIRRDWGWAPDYVDAMWRMLQLEEPQDFVVATGEVNSLEEFVAAAFARVDLHWRDHVRIDPALLRPSELRCGFGDATKAADVLGWRAGHRMADVVAKMVDAEVQALHGGGDVE